MGTPELPAMILMFACGLGVGACAGWMLGHATSRVRTVYVTRTQAVFLPEEDEPDCTMPPAPEPTDWEGDERDRMVVNGRRNVYPIGVGSHLYRPGTYEGY